MLRRINDAHDNQREASVERGDVDDHQHGQDYDAARDLKRPVRR